jgi:general secretion pathway protein G
MKSVSSRRRRGFTLIEVLMVLVILVIIMGLAVGNYFSAHRKAQVQAAQSQIGLFKTPLSMYQLDMGNFPSTAQGLDALCYQPNDPNANKWNGPYMDKIPLDPWGHIYHYESPGKNKPDYDVWAVGPDGQEIGNW